MLVSHKAGALTVGLVSTLSAAAFAQNPTTKPQSAKGPETLVVSGLIQWLETSDVSALTEGVVDKIEFHVGDRVAEKAVIGKLHDERAQLAVAKATIAYENKGAIAKAEAQRALAESEMARLNNLSKRGPNLVSKSEIDKASAEALMGEAMVREAEENQKLAKADLDLATQNLEEHKILAPFEAYVTDRLKNPGESVRSNEPVLRLGRIDKLKFVGYLRIENAVRLKGNEIVDVTPVIEGADLPIEKAKFRGKIRGLGTEISAVGRSEVQIIAEIDNKEDGGRIQLMPGMNAEMTIYLGDPGATTAVRVRTTR
jgi:RND family efflux transporter MFP subunit